MPLLKIGWVGLDADFDAPEQWQDSASDQEQETTLSGYILMEDLATTRVARDNLLEMAKLELFVPVTWDQDASVDGFYQVRSASVDTEEVSDKGYVAFEITLRRWGTDADLVFRSTLVSAVRANDHGVTLAEAEPVHAPPAGHSAYSSVVGSVSRTSEDGAITVYRDVSALRPTWSASPAEFLDGACRVKVGGYTRAGLSVPNSPADWELSNGLVRVRPGRSWGRSGSADAADASDPLVLEPAAGGGQVTYFPGTASNQVTVPLTVSTIYDYTVTYHDDSTAVGSETSDGSGVLALGGVQANFLAKRVKTIDVTADGGGSTLALYDSALASEPFASITDSLSKVWTLGRSTSGVPLTVVDRPMVVFDGVDDYLEVPDHADLDFGASDSFTVVAAGRWHIVAAAKTLISKYDASSTRWLINTDATPAVQFAINDGVAPSAVDVWTASPTARQLFVVAGVRNVADDDVETFVNGVGTGTPMTDGTSLSLANASSLTIGGLGTVSQFFNGQIFGTAIFREALTDAENLELGTWDWLVASEPSWVRERAAFYWNPDDDDAWTALVNQGQVLNLADGVAGTQHPGGLEVSHYDGTRWVTRIWQPQLGGVDIGDWEWMSVLRNDPEECIVRLENSLAGGGKNTLDLSLTRGSRFMTGLLTVPTAATLKTVLAVAEAGQTVTPTGASSAVAVEAAANDAFGHRYVVGSPSTHTADTTNGGLSIASVTQLKFFLGSEVAGSAAVAGDTSESLCLQYLGLVAESVNVRPR